MNISPCKTFALDTLGCRLNQAESESIARQLIERGYRITLDLSHASVYILNTCTVTHTADRKSRQLLRHAHRCNPCIMTMAIGCYAERNRNDILRSAGADIVLRNIEKESLIDILEGMELNSCDRKYDGEFLRTRSLVKIQAGCNQYCSYCIVPFVRDREHSVPIDKVLDEIKSKIQMGYREVVLTGTRIGSYSPRLDTLVSRILAETPIERLRLSSLQPHEVKDELLSLFQNDRVCRHIHLPLQSGSERTLEQMKRPYFAADYRNTIHRIRDAVPDIAVTTDVIVGFPGETGDDFNENYRFCQEMDFSRMHVFPYSPRPGTAAASMPGRIDNRTTRERANAMLHLACESSQRFIKRFTDRTMPVLWEQETDKNLWTGLTDNYIRVFTRSDQNLRNRLEEVQLSPYIDIKYKTPGLWADHMRNRKNASRISDPYTN